MKYTGKRRAKAVVLTATQKKYLDKCVEDFEFFCRNEVKIIDTRGVAVPFIWNGPQHRVAAKLVSCWKRNLPINMVVVKARQWGCSTLVMAFFMWVALYTEHQSLLVLVHHGDLVPKWREKYKQMYLSVRDEYKPKIKADNDGALLFENGSGFEFQSAGTERTASQVGRGTTYQLQHLTEVPMWFSPEKTLTGCKQATHTGPRRGIIMESTPMGASGPFYDTYMRAKTGDSDYMPVFVPWHEIEWYRFEPDKAQQVLWSRWREEQDDEARKLLKVVPDNEHRIKRYKLDCGQWLWYSWKLRNDFEGDAERMRQEFADDDVTCFLKSGGAVFGSNLTAYLVPLLESPPRYDLELHEGTVTAVEDEFGVIHAKELPVPGAEYQITADCAEGGTHEFANWSVAHVCRRSTDGLYLAAMVRVQSDPADFAYVLYLLWLLYNKALMAPEQNGPGIAVVQELRRLGVYNIYRRQEYAKVAEGEGSSSLTSLLGWKTTPESRELMIATAKKYLKQQRAIFWSKNLYMEFQTFIVNPKSRKKEAIKGKQDDEVLTFCIACQIDEQAPDAREYAPRAPEATPRQDYRKFLQDESQSGRISQGLKGFLSRFYQ